MEIGSGRDHGRQMFRDSKIMDRNLGCDEYGNDDVLTAVSDCLQEIVTAIDIRDEAVSMATQLQTKNESSQSVSIEENHTKPRSKVNSSSETHEKSNKCGPNFTYSSPPMFAKGRPTVFNLQSFLPHEGSRWVSIRDRMLTVPQFQKYAKRACDDSQWSLDEAFISFCLDRLEDDLALPLPEANHQRLPAVPKTSKKATRRKGQPRKYERTQNDQNDQNDHNAHNASIQAEKTRYANTFYLDDEFEDEDILSMDDNPSDLDYEPVSIIRYKKTPSRRMPRRNSTRGSKDEIMTASMETASDVSCNIVEFKPKQAKPKRKVQSSKVSQTKTDMAPPRKRGRPRKNPADPPKVRGKKGRPPLTEEQRIAKRKAYNNSRTRTRLEVIRDALPKILRCKACVEQFTDTETMMLHYFEVHRQQQISELDRQDPASAYNTSQLKDIATVLRECPTCKEYVENMTRHNRKHQTRNFICEECGKFFVTRMRLKLHMRIHTMDRTGERLHCDKCDKSYRCISSLQRHQLIHGGKKTFICDQCGKDFFNSVRLRVHRAVHMKEKPYKCPDCGRGFTQLTNLRSHQRVHTGIKPYKCDLCQDSFTHKVSLKMHKKKKHGIDWWKENGIQVEDRKSSRKKSAYKKVVDKESMEKELADMKTYVDQQHTHMDEAVRNYEFVSNLITHGSKTYAQLERKSSAGEAFHSMINPFENQWHS